MLAAGHPRAGARRLAGDARPLPYPHAALPARRSTGTVVRHLGDFPNPEDLAFARPAPTLPLYHVAFDRRVDLARGRVRRRDCWWSSSSPGWSRHEHDLLRADSDRAAGRGARPAGREGHRRRAEEIAERIAHHRRAPARPRAPAWSPAPGPTRTTARCMLRRRHGGGGGAWASRCAALPPLGVLENTRGCTTWSSARCAAATRARCWATRRSGSNRPPTAPAPCATRAACWRSGARCCRTGVRDPRGGQHGRLPLDGAAAAPRGHRGLGGDRLAALVREGDMIGVTVPGTGG